MESADLARILQAHPFIYMGPFPPSLSIHAQLDLVGSACPGMKTNNPAQDYLT
jgi:hypothetical protein